MKAKKGGVYSSTICGTVAVVLSLDETTGGGDEHGQHRSLIGSPRRVLSWGVKPKDTRITRLTDRPVGAAVHKPCAGVNVIGYMRTAEAPMQKEFCRDVEAGKYPTRLEYRPQGCGSSFL